MVVMPFMMQDVAALLCRIAGNSGKIRRCCVCCSSASSPQTIEDRYLRDPVSNTP